MMEDAAGSESDGAQQLLGQQTGASLFLAAYVYDSCFQSDQFPGASHRMFPFPSLILACSNSSRMIREGLTCVEGNGGEEWCSEGEEDDDEATLEDEERLDVTHGRDIKAWL